MQFAELFRALSEHRCKYLICGGLAINIYGVPRSTPDIDLLLSFKKMPLRKFSKAVETFGYFPELPISLESLAEDAERARLLQEKNLIAYPFRHAQTKYMHLDVLLDLPITFEEMWEAREIRKFQNFEVYLVSLPHLIALKKHANRERDVQDLVLLQKLKTK